MKVLGAGRFAATGAAIALVFGAVAYSTLVLGGWNRPLWFGLGWTMMTLIGLASGALMEQRHGKSDNLFLAGLAGGMLARLFGAAAGAGLATLTGASIEAVWAYLVGIVAGYLPLQAFELVWFTRKTRLQVATGAGSGT